MSKVGVISGNSMEVMEYRGDRKVKEEVCYGQKYVVIALLSSLLLGVSLTIFAHGVTLWSEGAMVPGPGFQVGVCGVLSIGLFILWVGSLWKIICRAKEDLCKASLKHQEEYRPASPPAYQDLYPTGYPPSYQDV